MSMNNVVKAEAGSKSLSIENIHCDLLLTGSVRLSRLLVALWPECIIVVARLSPSSRRRMRMKKYDDRFLAVRCPLFGRRRRGELQATRKHAVSCVPISFISFKGGRVFSCEMILARTLFFGRSRRDLAMDR